MRIVHYIRWMLDDTNIIYLLPNTTPHIMFDTAFDRRTWPLKDFPLCLLNSSVRTSISSWHFSSSDDLPTPKSRMLDMANFLVNSQLWLLNTIPDQENKQEYIIFPKITCVSRSIAYANIICSNTNTTITDNIFLGDIPIFIYHIALHTRVGWGLRTGVEDGE